MTSYEACHSLLAALPIFVFGALSASARNRAVRAEKRYFQVFHLKKYHFLTKSAHQTPKGAPGVLAMPLRHGLFKALPCTL